MAKKSAPESPDPIAAEMGKRLRAARKDQHMTQAELAQRCQELAEDAPGSTAIGNYENGLRRFTTEYAQLFAEVLDQHPGYFLAVLDSEEAAIIGAVRKHRGKGRGSK